MEIINATNTTNNPRQTNYRPVVIDEKAMKAILYLGIRGELSLPKPENKVDILV